MLFIISGLVFIIISVYYILTIKHNYWKKRNVPFIEPTVIFGNYKEYILLKKSAPEVTRQLCHQFPNASYFGVFYGTEPALVIKDPTLVKLVLTKDFYYFNGREITNYTHKELVTQNVFFTQGDRWKILRQNLTPLFSSLKMKNMFYMVKKCATELEQMLDREFSKSPITEAKAIMSKYTIDSITLCAFGVNANTMGTNVKDNPFLTISEKMFEITTFNGFKHVCRGLWPGVFYSLGLTMFSKELDEFFHKLLVEVFRGRNYEPSPRNDFIDLILTLHKNKFITGDCMSNLKSGDNKKITLETDDDFLVCQCIAFFGAGFETSSSSLSFVLFELAKHEDIQNRVIADVDAYLRKHKDGLEYDLIDGVPYLEACLDESLRLHPLFGTITREVMEDYTLPDGLRLQKGLRVHIPVYHLHMNPDYFPNPEEYIPERFLGENFKNIQPYTYFPFGEGPRICIGMRFAKMQVLAGLITIFKNYRIKLADGMPRNIEFEPKGIVAQPANKIKLTLIPRNK